jgi:hypothetical protein
MPPFILIFKNSGKIKKKYTRYQTKDENTEHSLKDNIFDIVRWCYGFGLGPYDDTL